jgi:hypothetical protein
LVLCRPFQNSVPSISIGASSLEETKTDCREAIKKKNRKRYTQKARVKTSRNNKSKLENWKEKEFIF